MKVACALALVVAAVAAAAPALAATPTLRGYVWVADAPQPTHFVTDTLAPGGGRAAPVVKAKRATGSAFITDTLAPGGGAAQQPVTVSVDRRFAWSDAGVGALATAGLVLIVLGGAVLVRQRMRPAV
jgi:hypothetical protein